jgi:DNA-binding response OmpR family regulator
MATPPPTTIPPGAPGRPVAERSRRSAILVALPPRVLPVLTRAAQTEGLRPVTAATAEALRDALFDEEPSVVVVYFGRDVAAGMATCRTIRKHPTAGDVPLLALLDPAGVAEFPLDCLVEDVLLLPGSEEEAALRLRLATWRKDYTASDAVMKLGDLVIDTTAMQVRHQGVPVDLTFKEFSLLKYFVENRGIALTRDAILASVWGADYLGGDRTVDIHVRRLRAKLPTLEDHLETVHGVGYRLNLASGGGLR